MGDRVATCNKTREELLGALFTALKSSLKKEVIGSSCEKLLGGRDNAVDAIFGIELEQKDTCQETEAEPVKVTTSLDYKLRVNIDGGSSSTEKVDHMFQGMHKALKGQIEKKCSNSQPKCYMEQGTEDQPASKGPVHPVHAILLEEKRAYTNGSKHRHKVQDAASSRFSAYH